MTWGRYTFRVLVDVEAADAVSARDLVEEGLIGAAFTEWGVWRYVLDDDPWYGADLPSAGGFRRTPEKETP